MIHATSNPRRWRRGTLAAICKVACLLVLTAVVSCSRVPAVDGVRDITSPRTWETPDWGGHPVIRKKLLGGFSIETPAHRKWAAVAKTVSLAVESTPVL